MKVVDNTFYEKEYGGNIVDADSFDCIYRRAEAVLNRLTFNRISAVNGMCGQWILYCTCKEFESFTEEEADAMKLGLCSLMDALVKLEKAEQQAIAGNSADANVKSRSSGGESISYESRKTIYDEALTDEAKKNKLYRNALMEYMQPCIFRHNPFYAGLGGTNGRRIL